ncbi:MAG: hypothetical protein WCP21_03985 [Armatimonadota bacterium]
MRKFHHFGLPTDQVQPDETYVPATKVFVTDPMKHPQKIEFLRFEADAELTGPVRDMPHLAYACDCLDEEIVGATVLLGPFEAMPGLRVVFVEKEGAVIEFMEFAPGMDWGTSDH